MISRMCVPINRMCVLINHNCKVYVGGGFIRPEVCTLVNSRTDNVQ
ncbi:MAG: hypothetical protein FWG87_06025 [Defluviitaleaceae bacterium]|nr:hypothetical protein [Defluviitaleaceae bacterium]